MIKTAFLLGSLNRGGTETLMLDVLQNAKLNNLNAICVYRRGGALEQDFILSKESIYKLRVGKNIFSYLYGLRKLLIQNQIGVAHAQQPVDALYAYLACWGLKTKVVLTIHGYDFKYPKSTKLILRFIHRKIALNIFVSHAQKKYFDKKYGFKDSSSRVLYNGISFDKFEKYQSSSISEEFGIPKNHLLLGSVGNFNPARDQMTICRFLNLLKHEKVLFSFVFAGAQTKADPWYYNDCIQYCRDNDLLDRVHFPGSRDDVPNFLSQLDAFIYSTDHDTFGIAIIEAIYMGLPVFVNDWEVINEVTGDGAHASLYKTRDEKSLLKEFKEYLINAKAYKKKSKDASKWAKETYSIQTHIKNLESLYSHII